MVIFMTDGYSNQGISVYTAAPLLHQTKAEVYSVGIGNYNPSEVRAINSSAGNVYELNSFDQLNDLISILKKQSCETVGRPEWNFTVQRNITLDGVTNSDSPAYYNIETLPEEGITLELKSFVEGTVITAYVSYTFPNPSEALYDFYFTTEYVGTNGTRLLA